MPYPSGESAILKPMDAREPSSLAPEPGEAGAERPRKVVLGRTWLIWWVLCAGLWMVLDDTTAFPELVDGAVAATIGASASTLAFAHTPLRFRPRAGWARSWWRPWAGLVTGVPLLTRVLVRALAGGDRDPGELRWVDFAVEADPAARAAQVALASFAGSVSPSSIVVDVDETRGSMLVHELVPGAGAGGGGPDPLRLGADKRSPA